MKFHITQWLLIGTLGLVINTQAIAGGGTTLAGLMNPVEVLYPETQVPTVRASSMADAAFMNGYLHAKDRMFQMDYTRRLASGTVSELVGAAGLSTDIQLRSIGFARAALRSYFAASEETKVILRSYANGVNAWLATNSLPVEYTGLEISTIKRWSPIDSLGIVKLIAFELSHDLQELDWTVAIGTFQQVGATAGFDGTALFMEDLYRSAPPDDRVTVPGFLESIGGTMLSDTRSKMNTDNFTQYSKADINLAKEISDTWSASPILSKLKNNDSSDKGSNVWAISASHTENGFPIVANDPHLSLGTPSVFYPIHLYVENDGNVEYNAAGVGFPGAPVIAQGCNQHLCWGSTVHPVDETDFYFEDIKTNIFGLPTHTVYQGNDEPIQWIFQIYYANQVGDGIMDNIENQNIGLNAGAITFIVPRRNNGPILSIDSENSRAVSMQYTGFSATQEVQAFVDMTKAENIFEFRQATTYFDVGSQNFGVADIHGNIGYYTGAEVPIREDLQTMMTADGVPPMFIRDGTGVRKNEWMSIANPQANQAEKHEIIPEAEMPHWENPAQGWFANANNDPIGVSVDNNVLNQLRPDGGLYYLSQGGYSAYRMGRIDRLIKTAIAAGKVDEMDMKVWQSNSQSMDAELIMPHILNAFNNASDAEAWVGIQQFLADPKLLATIEKFNTWDYSMPTGVAEGYDPFENPFALGDPSAEEIDYSIAATIYSTWRSMAIRNTIDATINGIDAAIGQDVLSPHLPSSQHAFNGFKNLLDNFAIAQGYGASGINFFTNPQAPTREDARDYIILASLKQALDLLASDEFAPAFNNSDNIMDYRWGKLHRIEFSHVLGSSLTIPNGLFGFSTIAGLDGIPRAGGYQVLDASGHNVRANSLNGFMFASGAARRFVGEMTDLGPVMAQVIPGGQSGVVTSGPLYVNQLFSWLVNSYLPLFIDINLIDQIAVDREMFEP
ncbi:Penicillin amidase precursor [hydrothermal vent metagenome]|uniref:Penicillin amidase n=1 Tax=hydrothermal vent metagenome TaxID=652676 RepID=A0A3B0VHZ1_9ZZZZ